MIYIVIVLIAIFLIINLVYQVTKFKKRNFLTSCLHKNIVLQSCYFPEVDITIVRYTCLDCGFIGRCSDVPSLAFEHFKVGIRYTNTFINSNWKSVTNS